MSKWDPSTHLDRLQEPIERLEAIRKEVLAKASRGQMLILFWLAGSLGIGALVAAGANSGVPLFISIAVAVISMIIIYHNYIGSGKSRYNMMFKLGLVDPLVKSVEPGMNYDPGRGISEDLFRSAVAALFGLPPLTE